VSISELGYPPPSAIDANKLDAAVGYVETIDQTAFGCEFNLSFFDRLSLYLFSIASGCVIANKKRRSLN